MGQDQKNTTWLVTVNDGTPDASTYQVTAAYPRTDQGNYPGYILLCDEDKTLVALVPDRPLLLIRRKDSDPTMTRRSDVPPPAVPGSIAKRTPSSVPRPSQTPASRRSLEQLAARGSKPGDV